MTKIWRKCKGKLAVQLGMSILLVNLLVLILCFSFQFLHVRKILLEKDERGDIERFEQSEYNVYNFCEQVDLASRKLTMDYDLKKISDSTQLSEENLFYHATQIFSRFMEIQNNYSYVSDITYYGDDGLILKSTTGQGTWLFQDTDKENGYYSSRIFRLLSSSRQKLKWYGGYADFVFPSDDTKAEAGSYYISAARNTISGAGTLIISVDMDYFLNIFNASDAMSLGNIYVIDEDNRIIAAKDAGFIGEVQYFPKDREINNGISRYVEDNEYGKFQVITYSLTDLGWSVISKTPIAEITREIDYLRNILLFSCLISVVISFALSAWWVSQMLKPLDRLSVIMRQVGDGCLGYTMESPPENELGEVAKQFNQMSLRLKDLFEQNELMEKEKRKLEMRTLRDQINPHLIYNTLNTIKWMALINDERNIAEGITLLSDFLEPVFKNQDMMCTVGEELDYIKKYIAIMNLRCTEEYALKCDVPEEYYNYKIIRFLLQPIVENAVLHGLAEKGFGEIHISMLKEGRDGTISISDNGIGMEEEQLQVLLAKLESNVPGEERGIGILNVNLRIKSHYGKQYGLDIASGKEKGTVVTLKICLEEPAC